MIIYVAVHFWVTFTAFVHPIIHSFKYTIQWLLVRLQSCAASSQSILEILAVTKRNPAPVRTSRSPSAVGISCRRYIHRSPFVTGFPHLTQCFRGSFVVQRVRARHAPCVGMQFACLPVGARLGRFCPLAVVNHAAGTCTCRFLCERVLSLGHTLRGSIAGSHGDSSFTIWRTSRAVFRAAAPLCVAISSVRGFQFVHVLAHPCFVLFVYSHPTGCEGHFSRVLICIFLV